MENYVALFIKAKESQHDELVAYLTEYDSCVGFEQEDKQLIAYFTETGFEDAILEKYFLKKYQVEKKFVESQNWNELWEKSFPMVFINGICEIYASHHTPTRNYPYSIYIQPQMSFGTGHHPTTKLMISLIHELPIENLTILDMGAGTGILGIFALMKGAKSVTFIDIEELAVENIEENIKANSLPKQEVLWGGAEVIPQNYPIILANINRNILEQDGKTYVQHLEKGGYLLISGFFDFDVEKLKNHFLALGLSFEKSLISDGWAALQFRK